jgi:hypothetical protein
MVSRDRRLRLLTDQFGQRVLCSASEHPRPMSVPGVREETLVRYKANGSAVMTDTSLVRARF